MNSDTPLHDAATTGDVNRVQELVARDKASVRMKGEVG